ncbi:MAG: hypothetical protein GY765_12725, partial [bacterium]|nr:hypothetical protein [bacterium]
MPTQEEIEILESFSEEIEEILPEVEKNIAFIHPFAFNQPFELFEYINFLKGLDVP